MNELPPNQELSPLEKFQDFIQEQKNDESREGKTVHLREIDPKDLTAEDMTMYARVIYILNDPDFSERDFEVFIKNEFPDYKEKIDSTNLSRNHFAAYLGNKVMVFHNRESSWQKSKEVVDYKITEEGLE